MAEFISNQNLADFDRIKKAFPGISDEAADDYYAKTVEILRIIRDISPRSGSGSPEGVVTSGLSQLYVDSDVNQLYWNPDFGVDTGWVAL